MSERKKERLMTACIIYDFCRTLCAGDPPLY